MGCCSILSNSLCDTCRDKKWVEEDRKYFCKRFETNLERLDGNSGGAVRSLQCIKGKPQANSAAAKATPWWKTLVARP